MTVLYNSGFHWFVNCPKEGGWAGTGVCTGDGNEMRLSSQAGPTNSSAARERCIWEADNAIWDRELGLDRRKIIESSSWFMATKELELELERDWF